MAQLKARFERISQGQKTASFTVFPKDAPALLDIPLAQILPDPAQPRRDLGDLTGLQASIAAHGLMQPLVVSPASEDRYQLIAGERRYTAAKALGLATVPALVRTVAEHQRLELQLVENLHRKDLNPLEEAASYQRLIGEFGLTQEEVARRLGKSLSAINQALRLLALPAPIQAELQTSEHVSKSVLLELVKAKNKQAQAALWAQAKQGQLTVQQARQQKAQKKPSIRAQPVVRQFKTAQALITLRFRKAQVTKQEMRAALQEALRLVAQQEEP
jgi:ParB family transcriptional regulator, chromosome partitioning protein